MTAAPPAAPVDAAPPPAPVVSILLIHYRTPALLGRCLETLAAAGTRVPSEVLVLDNAPLDDAARELASRHGAHYQRNARNLGYGRAVNAGIARARGRYFLILNPDIEIRPGSIDALVGYLETHPAVGIAGPKLFSPDGSLQYSARTFYTLKVILLRRTPLGKLFPRARAVREHLMMDWDHAEVRSVDWLLGGALLVRRAAVEDVGGMDERFFLYFEDVDWCSRMHRRGWQVVYVPQAGMVHAHQRASARGFLSRGQRIHLESALRFWEKWSLVLYLWKRQATELRAAATLGTDLALLSGAFLAAYLTRYLLGLWIPGWSEGRPVFALQVYLRFLPFADLIAIGTFFFLKLYQGAVWRDGWREFLQLVKGIAITSLVVLAVTFLFTTRPLSRFTILIFFPYALIMVAGGRALLRRLVSGVRERNIQLRRLAVFAPAARIARLRERFARHGTFGYEPLYLAHEAPPPGAAAAAGLDPIAHRLRFVEHERIAEIAVFEDPRGAELLAGLMPRLRQTGLPILYVPLGERFLEAAASVRDFMGFGAVALPGRGAGVGGPLKRVGDAGLAALLLLVGLLPHLLQRLLVRGARVTSERRIGRAGRAFDLRRYARPVGPARWLPGLRHYPALRNILAGEMSFVGPIALTAEQWAAADPDYRRDPPTARPGILTPLRRVGLSGIEDLDEILAVNRRYAQTASSGEDLRIALEALVRRRGGEGSRP